jgi:hypothetical protein
LEQRGSIYLQDQAPSICRLKAGWGKILGETDFGNSLKWGKVLGRLIVDYAKSAGWHLSCNIGVPLSHEPLDNS